MRRLFIGGRLGRFTDGETPASRASVYSRRLMAIITPNGAVIGLLTPTQAAEYLACSQRSLRNYVAGGLPFVQIGNGHRRFRVEDLNGWIEARLFQATPKAPRIASVIANDPVVAEIERELRARIEGAPLRHARALTPKRVR
jgi:excisionase family DNA binding protein